MNISRPLAGHRLELDLPRKRLRQWLLRPSVRAKIMGIVLGLVLLLGLVVTLEARLSMTTTLTAQLDERGISIARDLAARAADPILINNTYALHQLLQDTLLDNTDLRYAFILDTKGQVLVHSFDQGMPRGLAAQNNAVPSERAHGVSLASDEGIIHDVAAAIFDGRAGVARVGLTEGSVRAAVDQLTGEMLLTTLAVSLLGVGAAYLLTLILTRPILALVGVTQAVARGDLSQRAPPWGDDEIGQLSGAFNRMTAELEQAQRAMLRRQRELTALNAVANTVNAPAPLDEMLDRSLGALLESLGFSAGWIFMFERETQQIELASWRGLTRELAAREVENGLRGCPCSVAVREQHAVVVSPLPVRCPLRLGRLEHGAPIASHVAVPIRARARVLGVIGAASADEHAFTSDEVKLLEAVGQQLGAAVENARLWDELREKERVRGQLLNKVIVAQEEERKRIARELHDDTGQAITSLMVGLRAATDACDPAVRAQFSALREIAAQTLESVKRMARELRPAVLDDLGLPAALERYVSGYRANFGLKVDLQITGWPDGERLPVEAELALYRIIQESLTNIVKHAHAGNVSIVVTRKPHAVVAIVEDDGCGFDARSVLASPNPDGTLGLFGMRERAELMGGRMQLESTPGSGTSVFVEIPV
jgi:signal transduction histidine kinase